MTFKLHRRSHPAVPALLLALLLALVAAPARAVAAVETYWLDGYEVKATLEPTRAAFVLGEPVTLVLKFENHSDTDLELLLSGEDGRGWPDGFDVRVVGSDGKVVPRPDKEGNGGASHSNTFVPVRRDAHMATVSVGVMLSLKEWARLDKPGIYTVTLRRGAAAGPYNGSYRLWPETEKPRMELRLQTQFRVVEEGEARLSDLIEELAAKMLVCDANSSVEAAMRLYSINDERGIKPFLNAFSKCKVASIRYTALQSFSKFPTDAAFEGLRLASSDADEDFRTVATLEISRSKHPKAAALLLSMRSDPYYGVRLMVLNALEATDTEEARRLIWEMTNDKHPSVRDEARRFLQERPTASRP